MERLYLKKITEIVGRLKGPVLLEDDMLFANDGTTQVGFALPGQQIRTIHVDSADLKKAIASLKGPGVVHLLSDTKRLTVAFGDDLIHIARCDGWITNGSVWSWKPAHSMTLDRKELILGLERTIFASTKDKSRPELNGILFQPHVEALHLVATDGRRLSWAKVSIPGEQWVPTATCLLPREGAEVLLRVLKRRKQENVTVHFDEKGMECLEMRASSPGSRGFPNWEALADHPGYTHLILPLKDLKGALTAAKPLTAPESRAVRLALARGVLTLDPIPDAAEGASGLPVSSKGSFDDEFHIDQLLDLARKSGVKELDMECTDPGSPARFRAPNFVHVLMPLSAISRS